jgi:hypothetical protein
MIRLTWTPPRTLFDETDTNRQEPTYVVYLHINSSALPGLLYQAETSLPSRNMTLRDLNVTACNLSNVFFRVSAKFEGVGEGNVSLPKPFEDSVSEDVCMTGKIISNV